MTERDAEQPEQTGLRATLAKLSTVQQRFEESERGKVVISILVAAIVLAGIGWNLPDSPIKRGIAPLLKPIAIVNLDQSWAVFAPSPPRRLDTVEVQVTMADGSSRLWRLEPGTRVDRLFASSHWERLMNIAVLAPDVRPGIARWVVREVTGPTERAVSVAMILHTQNLAPPGEGGRGATATKILYEEDLTASQ